MSDPFSFSECTSTLYYFFTFKRNRKRNSRSLRVNFFSIKVKVLFSPLSLFILPFTIYIELLFNTFYTACQLIIFSAILSWNKKMLSGNTATESSFPFLVYCPSVEVQMRPFTCTVKVKIQKSNLFSSIVSFDDTSNGRVFWLLPDAWVRTIQIIQQILWYTGGEFRRPICYFYISLLLLNCAQWIHPTQN